MVEDCLIGFTASFSQWLIHAGGPRPSRSSHIFEFVETQATAARASSDNLIEN